MNLAETLSAFKIIPVVEIPHAELAEPLAESLIAGGLPIVEVTFRTDDAAASISRISTAFPEMHLGAGTLLSKNQMQEAIDAGAKFGVAPGLNRTVADFAFANGFQFIPGINTPSELELGLELGFSLFKIFPAEPIGARNLIPAFGGPYPHANFMPTGGVTKENLLSYLQIPTVMACGGTWIAPKSLIANREFAEISHRAREAVLLIQEKLLAL